MFLFTKKSRQPELIRRFTDGKIKTTSFTRLRFNPYSSSMPLHDLFADGQSDSCSAIFILVMQPLKKHKDLFKENRFDANTVIAYTKNKIIFFFLSLHMH